MTRFVVANPWSGLGMVYYIHDHGAQVRLTPEFVICKLRLIPLEGGRKLFTYILT